jgi:hypothetical protein
VSQPRGAIPGFDYDGFAAYLTRNRILFARYRRALAEQGETMAKPRIIALDHPNRGDVYDSHPDPEDDGLHPDVDREDGVDNPDDQDEEDRPVAPGEVRTDRFGNVTIGAVAARASSDVHLPR